MSTQRREIVNAILSNPLHPRSERLTSRTSVRKKVTMPRRRKSRPPARKKSGLTSRALAAEANRLDMLTTLDSRGALLRTVLSPSLRLLAAGLGWWSHSWLGQALGLGWIKTNFMLGLRDRLDPSDIGDDWPIFQNGNVKRE
jgi:hypothetical protein